MKLNAFLSRNGVSSRRKAVDIIRDGKVSVNGKFIREPWHEVKDGDSVTVSGRKIQERRHIYIIINKPKGVTSTLEDPHARSKVTDLIDPKFGRIYPVGRLDKDSRGLMILTSDGGLCYRLTHPKFEIEKEYLVTVKGAVEDTMIKKLIRGIMSDGDLLRVKSAAIEKSGEKSSLIRAVICEGRKRHLRRLFGGLGMDVKDLVRIRIGDLKIGSLGDGQYRAVDRARLAAMLGIKYSA